MKPAALRAVTLKMRLVTAWLPGPLKLTCKEQNIKGPAAHEHSWWRSQLLAFH